MCSKINFNFLTKSLSNNQTICKHIYIVNDFATIQQVSRAHRISWSVTFVTVNQQCAAVSAASALLGGSRAISNGKHIYILRINA